VRICKKLIKRTPLKTRGNSSAPEVHNNYSRSTKPEETQVLLKYTTITVDQQNQRKLKCS
jgi:hypothetical protein